MMNNNKPLRQYQQTFLKEYWQRRPLLIRNAFPGGFDFVDPEGLAGLACQEGIDSRVVLEKGSYPWETHQGPFEESFFSKLPASHWTLLVQAVDRLLPEVSGLREFFRFIPNWRLDDIMISYAADQGSVGPHTDNYDVFLIQAIGQRRWEYGENPLVKPEFIDGIDLKILKEFKADHNFILEPGDMLYLPPNVAHHGVAVGSCMTYSVGFRAPTQNEMLVSYSQFLLQSENPEIFYSDDFEKRDDKASAGLISDAELSRLKELMISSLNDETIFRRWVGAFLTEPRNFHEPLEESLDWQKALAQIQSESTLHKVEGGRFAYHIYGKQVYLAVEGETLVLPLSMKGLVELLCSRETYTSKEILAFAKSEGFSDMMLHLWNQGYIRSPDDPSE